MTEILIPYNWDPRPYQRPAWSALQKGCKRAALVWHRRAGKDAMSLNWTAAAAMQRVGLYWHMAPTHKQVRKIVWDGITNGVRCIDQAFPKAIRAKSNDQEMKIELSNGSIWQCVGSDNYDSLVGANPVGVVFSEWSLADPTAWDYIRPILAENGGWALFIYTPRGKNHGKTLLDMAQAESDWFSQVLTVADTGVVSPEVIDQELRELTITHGADDAKVIVDQEWYCKFDGRLQGSIFGAQLEKMREQDRIGRVPFDPTIPVNTFWDIGHSDTTAIVFHQYQDMRHRFPLSFEDAGEQVEYYARYLQETQQKHGIIYGTHYLPHDAANSRIEGKSVLKQLTALLPGHRFQIVERVQDIWLGINDTRSALRFAWIDAQHCAGLILALENYRKRFNKTTEEFTDEPVHDRYSNYADALRQWGQGYVPKHQIVSPDTGKVETLGRRRRTRNASNWRTV